MVIKMKKITDNIIFRLIIASTAVFLIGAIFTLVTNADEVTDKFVRFHIIGNSDSKADQEIKMKVREEIFINLDLSGIKSKEEAITFFEAEKDSLEEIADKTLEANGFIYKANVKVGRKNFPIREYTSFALPSGTYDAVSIELGEAKGKNFFCVMYPGLCIIDGISEKNDTSVLSDKEINTITGDNVVIKFKIAEIFNKIIQK